MIIFRGGVSLIFLLLLWQCIVSVFQLPSYILPPPLDVMSALVKHADVIAQQMRPTLIETLLGLFLGACLGIMTALILMFSRTANLWLLPVLIVSQAIPTFAVAPLLVIWLGYGMASKVATAVLMLFFPVTSAFFDGLRRTPSGWLELAEVMGASRWHMLWHVRVPAALPALASGLRMAAVFAPMGAVIGEWVGSSRGLGFLMLNANARLQIDFMFATLLVLIAFSLLLYFGVDRLLRRIVWWR